MHLRKFLSLLSIVFLLVLLTACKQDDFYEENGKLKIVTTLFPQYDFVKQIAQDRADVKILVAPGVEPHSYEPRAREIRNITTKADLFIYTGEYMEPWAQRIIDGVKNDSLIIVDTSKNIVLMENEHEHEHEHGFFYKLFSKIPLINRLIEHDCDHGLYDPHIWVDPLQAIIMIENILEGLIEVDPVNEAFYRQNAQNYIQDLFELHEDFLTLFEQVPEDERIIIHGGHFAFGYFAKRYNVTYYSPYEGFSPNAEPSTRKIRQLIDLMRETNQRVVYSEELVSPRVARVIAEEANAEILILHGVHNVSRSEYEQGLTYIDLMRQNLAHLKVGFGLDE